jgi:large subunit ribosomal protein L3
LIGRKLGMTRVFGDDGTVVPVSVIQATPNSITRLRTPEQDGYAALQVGAGTARRVSKPVAGQFKELGKDQQKPAAVREFRVDSVEGYEVGQTLDVSLFEAGDLHHFRRGPKTHGSNNYRAPGSIGAGTTPGRVFKGTRMGGHMGDERVTVKKLTVVKVDADRNLLLVKGAVPGARNGLLLVQKAK